MNRKIFVFATKGTGSNEEARIQSLLEDFDVETLAFERKQKLKSALRIVKEVNRRRPRLVVMEGSGLAGGLALLFSRLFFRTPYVVSSGDAIAPFLAQKYWWVWPFAILYEAALYRFSAGFIGWTPYLCGRAMTFGAKRAVTAEGWALKPLSDKQSQQARSSIRDRLHIPMDAIVVGTVASLDWNEKLGFCYGADLVRAYRAISRKDMHLLIVGDGNGLAKLKEIAGDVLCVNIHLPGAVPFQQAMDYYSAMDIASVPQSLNAVGSFRYTTKISECFQAGLPILTTQVPMAYDLEPNAMWRISGGNPWEANYHHKLAAFLNTIKLSEINSKQSSLKAKQTHFQKEAQQQRIKYFILDLLDYSQANDLRQ